MEKLISRSLDTIGDGTGTINANGNYSDAGLGVTDFLIAPGEGEVFRITRMIISLVDTVGMDADAYGNNITLTHGIEVHVDDDSGVLYELTNSNNIKTNGDWAHYCYDAQLLEWGSGNEHMVARWTFEKFGQPIVLRGWLGEKLVVHLNDDFSGLVEQHFVVQGLEVAGEI